MKMMLVLFLVVAAFFADFALCQLSTYHNTGMNNVVFQHSLLFDQPVRSLLECATRCSEDDTCVTFTLVLQPSGDVSCRGHSLEMDPTSPTVSSGKAKAKTYVMTDTKGGECASSPCQNGGTCTYRANAYTCTCPAGYGGIYCESGTDECSSNPCQNGGTCTNHASAYTCTCPPSYTGTECRKEIDPCEPGGYTTLDNQERNMMSTSVVSLGDDVLPAGWYRFKLNGGNAMIPNSCTSANDCSSTLPLWMYTGADTVPPVGAEINVTACGGGPSCCEITIPIILRRCADCLIFYLVPTGNSDAQYCAMSTFL